MWWVIAAWAGWSTQVVGPDAFEDTDRAAGVDYVVGEGKVWALAGSPQPLFLETLPPAWQQIRGARIDAGSGDVVVAGVDLTADELFVATRTGTDAWDRESLAPTGFPYVLDVAGSADGLVVAKYGRPSGVPDALDIWEQTATGWTSSELVPAGQVELVRVSVAPGRAPRVAWTDFQGAHYAVGHGTPGNRTWSVQDIAGAPRGMDLSARDPEPTLVWTEWDQLHVHEEVGGTLVSGGPLPMPVDTDLAVAVVRDQQDALHVALGLTEWPSGGGCSNPLRAAVHLEETASGWALHPLTSEIEYGPLSLTEDEASGTLHATYLTRTNWTGWVEQARYTPSDVELRVAQSQVVSSGRNVSLRVSARSPSGAAIDEVFVDVSGTCRNEGAVFVRGETLWRGGPVVLGPNAVSGAFRVDVRPQSSWRTVRIGVARQGAVVDSALVLVRVP